MDPFQEQKLRDEVLYLHSLFHQSTHLSKQSNLPPSNSTKFKKPIKKNKPKKPKKTASFSGTEWPVKPISDNSPVTQTGWPELKLKPMTQTKHVLTPQELEKHNWNIVQQKVLKGVKDFYSKSIEESDEDENDFNVYDDDMDGMDEMDEGCGDVEDKDYEFLSNLFSGDEELKGYYLKHCGGGGEFSCLVCGGTNEKMMKKYKDCVALVQHSVSIAKTKRVRSHRAYGKVVCKVLGWDIDRLPSSIVTDHKCGELQGNDVNVADKIVESGESNEKTRDVLENIDDESMVCEESLVVENVEEETNGNQVLNETEGNTTGVVNNLEPVVNNGVGSSPRKYVDYVKRAVAA